MHIIQSMQKLENASDITVLHHQQRNFEGVISPTDSSFEMPINTEDLRPKQGHGKSSNSQSSSLFKFTSETLEPTRFPKCFLFEENDHLYFSKLSILHTHPELRKRYPSHFTDLIVKDISTLVGNQTKTQTLSVR